MAGRAQHARRRHQARARVGAPRPSNHPPPFCSPWRQHLHHRHRLHDHAAAQRRLHPLLHAPRAAGLAAPRLLLGAVCLRAAVRLLLFTGARRGEILSLRWSEVDLDRNVLNLADSKTGAKAITINAEAKAILSDLAADRRGRTYVIAGEDDAPRWDLNRPWRMITKAAGLEGFRLHDLRHQYATTGVSLGASLFIVGHLLGHANIATTERYAHAEDEPMLAAANIIGATLAKAIGRR